MLSLHDVIPLFETGIDDRGLVAVRRPQYVARLGQPEIDRGLGDSELPRDLLRGLSLDQEIETGPLLVGEARPAFGVLKCVRPRITNVHTLVKIEIGRENV